MNLTTLELSLTRCCRELKNSFRHITVYKFNFLFMEKLVLYCIFILLYEKEKKNVK